MKVKVNALSKVYPGFVDCIKTDVKIADPYTGKEIKTLAIWDTGATNSVITKSKAIELGLKPLGKAVVMGVHGAKEVSVYVAKITLNNENISLITQVSECDELSSAGDTGMLIGMNVIGKGDFSISSYGGSTVMTFRAPSIKRTDFVEELKEYNHCLKMHENNLLHHRPDKCACGSGKLFKNCHDKYIPDEAK